MRDDDPSISALALSRMLYRSALIVAAKGGGLTEITVGDVIELFGVENRRASPSDGRAVLYRMLHQLGIFAGSAPPTLRALRTSGQRTLDELIDRYHLACRLVRDLLVDYLRVRQPAFDYNSLDSTSHSRCSPPADTDPTSPAENSLRGPHKQYESHEMPRLSLHQVRECTFRTAVRLEFEFTGIAGGTMTARAHLPLQSASHVDHHPTPR